MHNTLESLINSPSAAFTEVEDAAPSLISKSFTEETELSRLMNQIGAKQRIDYVAPAANLVLNPGHSLHMENSREGSRIETTLSDLGHRQLFDRLSAGLNTVHGKMTGAGQKESFIKFVNELLGHSDKTFTVRTVKESESTQRRARAVLSNAFLALDDDMVFGTAVPIIADYGGKYKSIGGHTNDTGTWCKFVTREVAFSVNDNGKTRDFHMGFLLKNSEVGQGFCEFQAFATDRFCDNGILFSKFFLADCKFMHRGSKIETDFPMLLGDEVKASRVAEHRNLIETATRTACSAPGIEKIQAAIEASTSAKAGTNGIESAEIVENVAQAFKLSPENTTALQRLSGAESPTRFGVQSALTELAKAQPTGEEKLELEAFGGQVLTDDKLWKSVSSLS